MGHFIFTGFIYIALCAAIFSGVWCELVVLMSHWMGENRAVATLSVTPLCIPVSDVLGYLTRQQQRVEFFCPDYRDYILWVPLLDCNHLFCIVEFAWLDPRLYHNSFCSLSLMCNSLVYHVWYDFWIRACYDMVYCSLLINLYNLLQSKFHVLLIDVLALCWKHTSLISDGSSHYVKTCLICGW